MKILHVISGLTTGGAERMLHKLAVELARAEHVSIVACLGPRGGVADLLEAAGVEVHYLGLRKGPLALFGLGKLAGLARRVRPDIVQGWMYDGNLAATAAGAFVAAPVYWSIHQSLYSLRYEKPVNRALILLSAALSRLPRGILYVSRTGEAQHARIGFSRARAAVIPIGFDLEAFRPLSPGDKSVLRASLGARLGLDPSKTWMGWMGRDDAKKDPGNFVAAARSLAGDERFARAGGAEARFLMIGRGLDAPDTSWRARAREAGLEKAFFFQGETREPAAWLAALDVLVSSSYTEGFPNVIGEAMASGVPCAVTDVGDCARLVGDTGKVVPPRDPAALARALAELMEAGAEGRAELGARARARIRAQFSIASVADRYLEAYLTN